MQQIHFDANIIFNAGLGMLVALLIQKSIVYILQDILCRSRTKKNRQSEEIVGNDVGNKALVRLRNGEPKGSKAQVDRITECLSFGQAYLVDRIETSEWKDSNASAQIFFYGITGGFHLDQNFVYVKY